MYVRTAYISPMIVIGSVDHPQERLGRGKKQGTEKNLQEVRMVPKYVPQVLGLQAFFISGANKGNINRLNKSKLK